MTRKPLESLTQEQNCEFKEGRSRAGALRRLIGPSSWRGQEISLDEYWIQTQKTRTDQVAVIRSSHVRFQFNQDLIEYSPATLKGRRGSSRSDIAKVRKSCWPSKQRSADGPLRLLYIKRWMNDHENINNLKRNAACRICSENFGGEDWWRHEVVHCKQLPLTSSIHSRLVWTSVKSSWTACHELD